MPRLPRVGETLHGRDFRTGFGGKGANQAVMAARLGAAVTIVTRVGRDTFGDDTLRNFEAHGIDTTHVTVDDEAPTGVAPIAVDENGDNAIVIVTGANSRMTPSDVERARGAIEHADVVVCQLEMPEDVTVAALRLARASSTATVLNPAPAAADVAPDVYALADVLCPNQPEAELILGEAIAPGAEGVTVRGLVALGARAAVVTLGERGCAVGDRLLAAPTVHAVDTTGAGDAFVGSLAVRLGGGDRLEDAAAFANRVAALSVQRPGTQTSFPSAGEL